MHITVEIARKYASVGMCFSMDILALKLMSNETGTRNENTHLLCGSKPISHAKKRLLARKKAVSFPLEGISLISRGQITSPTPSV